MGGAARRGMVRAMSVVKQDIPLNSLVTSGPRVLVWGHHPASCQGVSSECRAIAPSQSMGPGGLSVAS